MPRPFEFHTPNRYGLASLLEGGGTPIGVPEGVSYRSEQGVKFFEK